MQKRTNVTYRDDNRRSPGNDGRKRSEGEAQTLRVEYKRKSVLTRNTVALSASPLLPRAMFQIVLQTPDRSPSRSDFLAVIASLRQLLKVISFLKLICLYSYSDLSGEHLGKAEYRVESGRGHHGVG